MSITLDANQYESFFSVISMIKDECTDIDIREGIIRQRNDTEHVIYELDLTDLIEQLNIPFSSIKPKIDLLKMFVGGDEIVLDSDDETHSVKDEFSKISFTATNLQFMDNKFIEASALTQIFNFDNLEPVFTYTFSKKVCERMRVIANNFSINSFTVEFHGETAMIKASPESRDQSAIIVDNIPLDFEISDKSCNITIMLTNFEHDGDLDLSMYADGNNVLASKSSSTVKGIQCDIYNRTRLI